MDDLYGLTGQTNFFKEVDPGIRRDQVSAIVLRVEVLDVDSLKHVS
jgi:hypothetical protein